MHNLRLIAAVLSASGSLASWFLYFTLYWPHRHEFNEAGRYVDEATLAVHHEQSGVLIIPALLLSALTLALLALAWRARRRPRTRTPQS